MLKELGDYKNRLRSIFVHNDDICKLLLGQDYESADYDLDDELDKYVIPHLYIPNTITETKSYILYETDVPNSYGQTKTMRVEIQLICHKDIVEYKEKPKGYPGLRYDVLSELIEELVCPQDKSEKMSIMKKFGIGEFELKSVGKFLTEKFIGRTLTFTVPDFR